MFNNVEAEDEEGEMVDLEEEEDEDNIPVLSVSESC